MKHLTALKIVLFKCLFKKEINNMINDFHERERLYNKNNKSICIEGFRYRFEGLFTSLEWYKKDKY